MCQRRKKKATQTPSGFYFSVFLSKWKRNTENTEKYSQNIGMPQDFM